MQGNNGTANLCTLVETLKIFYKMVSDYFTNEHDKFWNSNYN